MGGKQWKNRKHLLFYGACLLIVLSISEGCIIPARRVQVLPEGGTPVEQASIMVSKGDYNGALEEYGKIARSYPRGYPGDRALFEMGLIWVYPDNPKKNYGEALKYFQKLLRDFPRSPYKKEASAWADVLGRQTRHNLQVRELEDKIESHMKEISSCKENCKEEVESYKEEIESYKEEIESYKEEIESYKEQINALKAIDIGIEEKKRKVLPEE
jgi:tetratricopeptide (TPR) repeat protein